MGISTRLLTALSASGIAAAVVFAAPAAYARPDTRTMTCAEARALVQKKHSIVLTTGAHTYDKYVSGQRYCEWPFTAVPAWVATKDTAQCRIGFQCKNVDPIFKWND